MSWEFAHQASLSSRCGTRLLRVGASISSHPRGTNAQPNARSAVIPRLRRLLSGSAVIYLAGSVVSRLGSIVVIPLYTRVLTPTEYGDYALLGVTAQLVSIFFTLGVYAAIPKMYFSDPDVAVGRSRAGTVCRTMLSSTTLLAGLSAALVWAFASDVPGLLGRDELLVVIIAAHGIGCTGPPQVLLRVENKPWHAAGYQLVQFGVGAALGVYFVAGLHLGYWGSLSAYALANIIPGLIGVIYAIGLPGRWWDPPLQREALAFGLPFVAHHVANWSQAASDRWVLHASSHADELGPYSVAATMVSPVGMATTAWNDAAHNAVGERFRSGGLPAVRGMLGQLRTQFLLAVVVPAGGVLMLLPIIAFAIGGDFLGAIAYIPLLLLTYLPDVMYYTHQNMVYYGPRSRFIGMCSAASAGASLCLNVLLVPSMGVYGVLLARGISVALRATLMWRLGRGEQQVGAP